MRRPLRALGGVAARQPRFQVGLRIHRTLTGQRGPLAPSHSPARPRSPEAKRRNGLFSTIAAVAPIDVKKSYGQKAALWTALAPNGQMFQGCCIGATDSARRASLVNSRVTIRL